MGNSSVCFGDSTITASHRWFSRLVRRYLIACRSRANVAANLAVRRLGAVKSPIQSFATGIALLYLRCSLVMTRIIMVVSASYAYVYTTILCMSFRACSGCPINHSFLNVNLCSRFLALVRALILSLCEGRDPDRMSSE